MRHVCFSPPTLPNIQFHFNFHFITLLIGSLLNAPGFSEWRVIPTFPYHCFTNITKCPVVQLRAKPHENNDDCSNKSTCRNLLMLRKHSFSSLFYYPTWKYKNINKCKLFQSSAISFHINVRLYPRLLYAMCASLQQRVICVLYCTWWSPNETSPAQR